MLRAIVPQIQQVQAACRTVHIALCMSHSLTPVKSSSAKLIRSRGVDAFLPALLLANASLSSSLLSIPPAASDVTEAAAGMFVRSQAWCKADLACSCWVQARKLVASIPLDFPAAANQQQRSAAWLAALDALDLVCLRTAALDVVLEGATGRDEVSSNTWVKVN